MPLGSTYSTLKAAIVSTLSERPGLSTVNVGYAAPRQREDVADSTGSGDAIYLDEAEGEFGNSVFGAPGLWLDENYTLNLVIQSLQSDSDITQLDVDRRVDEMVWEVLDEMSNDAKFGVDVTGNDFVHMIVSRGGFRRVTGPLSPSGYGARLEFAINVEARIRFDPTD